MPPSLFDANDEAYREQLRELGWVQETLPAIQSWLRPDGVRVTEEEAFNQLASGSARYPEPRVG